MKKLLILLVIFMATINESMASIKGVAPQLASHQRGAVNMGNTQGK